MGDSALAERYDAASADTRRQIDRLLDQDADDRAWAEQLGPVYRQTDVAHLLGKSKQAVSADPRLLRLQMRGGDLGYPVFQFDGRRQLPGIGEVVTALADVVTTTWTTASWLTSPAAELEGQPPLAVLRTGEVATVSAAARRFAHALAT